MAAAKYGNRHLALGAFSLCALRPMPQGISAFC
jgi:hypothetical protein